MKLLAAVKSYVALYVVKEKMGLICIHVAYFKIINLVHISIKAWRYFQCICAIYKVLQETYLKAD